MYFLALGIPTKVLFSNLKHRISKFLNVILRTTELKFGVRVGLGGFK